MQINKHQGLFVFLVLVFSHFINPAYGKDLKASMAYLPQVLETTEKGVFSKMVKYIDDAYDGGKIIRDIYPFRRSIENIKKGKADFHIPLIKNPLINEKNLPFRYITSKVWDIVFIICSNRDAQISLADINRAKKRAKFPYIIHTDRAHVNYFDFPIEGSSHVEGSLKQVATKRIDAFIFAQAECDFVIRKLEQKYKNNIHRSLYKYFQGTIVIQKGPKGDIVDNILTKSFYKMEKNGQLQKLRDIIQGKYIEWQPY